MGKALVEVYLREASPSIQPTAVEMPVSGRIGGVPVSGYVDLLGVDGRIIDCETAARKPSALSHDYGLLCHFSRSGPGNQAHQPGARLETAVKQLMQLTSVPRRNLHAQRRDIPRVDRNRFARKCSMQPLQAVEEIAP